MNMKLFKRMTAIAAVVVVISQSSGVYAADVLPELTVDKAVQMAIDNSSELRTLAENTALTEASRDNIVSAFFTATTEKELINNAVSLMQNEMKTAAYNQNAVIQKQSIELSVTKFFAAVIAAERDFELYEKSLALAEKELRITSTKASLGIVSQSEHDNAKLSYEKNVANRDAKEIAIENAYKSLNQILGKSLNAKHRLVLDLNYKPIGESNLTTQTTEAVRLSADVISKKNDVAVAQYQVDAYIPEYNLDTVDERLYKLNQAERALTDQISKTESNVINTYNDIRSLENSYNANIMELENMNKQLEIKKTSLSLGKITELELENYEYQILQMEYKITGQINDHAVKVMQFSNPNLL